MSPHGGNDGLKFIPTFAGHTDFLALDLCRDFEFAVTNEAGDLLGNGGFQALFDLDDLPRMPER